MEKEPVAIECEVSDATSKVKWTKGGKAIKLDERVREETDGNIRRLIFESAEFGDAGDYTCTFEKLTSTAKLTVDGKM